MAVVVRYQSVSNIKVPDDVFFPSIMRDKKLALDFQWHGGKPMLTQSSSMNLLPKHLNHYLKIRGCVFGCCF